MHQAAAGRRRNQKVENNPMQSSLQLPVTGAGRTPRDTEVLT